MNNTQEKEAKQAYEDLKEKLLKNPDELEKFINEIQRSMNFTYHSVNLLEATIKRQYEDIINLKKQVK